MWPLIVLVLIAAGGAAFFLASRHAFRVRALSELDLKLFLVRFPQRTAEGKDEKQEIALSEQLFAALVALKKPFVFEIAVPHIGEEIRFFVAVPSRFCDTIERQIQSLWSDASVEPSPDFNVFNYAGVSVAASVRQKRHFALPFRTYAEAGTDTFLPILGGLAKINEIGEGGAVQFAVMPAKKKRKRVIQSKFVELKRGGKLTGVLESSPVPSVKEIVAAAVKAPVQPGEQKEKLLDDSALKAFESKLAKPLFEVNIRIAASAASQVQAESILDGIATGFSQFGAPDRNELTVVRPRNPAKLFHKFSFRSFVPEEAMVLSSEELASVFHFPTAATAIPKIKTLAFKEAPPPPNLPKEGILLGESRYHGVARAVRMMRDDRRRHLYIVGQTGTGKTVCLNDLAGQDIVAGEGVCVIDPNGDFFQDMLARVPRERVKDLIVFDPSDLDRPLGLNMLEYDPKHPEQKTFIVNELLNIFNTLYDMKVAGGPMFEQYLRFSLLLLMDDPADGFTVLEIPRVLADGAFRKRLLEKCQNAVAKNFWEKEAEKAGGEQSLANMVPYITSKFNAFTGNDYVRPIIEQSKTTLNFRKVMDGQQILLVNLSKGRIGELNASLLGMMIVGKLTLAAFSRDDIAPNDRKDFYLYIDEFQNFTTPAIATIMSEARKYRLCLTVAHQFIGQLKEDIRNAIFGNVGSMVAFRVGADDAEFLVKQFEPVFNLHNLVNIDNLNAHAKLIVANQVSQPFNIFVPFPPKGDPEVARLGREYSRLTYGRDRTEVEEEARVRSRS
jgi:hypothetical protein